MRRPWLVKATEIVDALALERAMNKGEDFNDPISMLWLPFVPESNKGQNIAGAQQAAEGNFQCRCQSVDSFLKQHF